MLINLFDGYGYSSNNEVVNIIPLPSIMLLSLLQQQNEFNCIFFMNVFLFRLYSKITVAGEEVTASISDTFLSKRFRLLCKIIIVVLRCFQTMHFNLNG